MPVDVEVVVVAYGTPELLERCLTTLGAGISVTVVDNSSDPEVRSAAERHGATYLDPERNLGFAAGVNLGLGRCRSSADVLLLNPDATIDRAGVDALVRCLHARSDRACVAPAQLDPSTGEPARVAWPLPTPFGAWVEAVGFGRLRRGHQFMIGSVLLLRRSALIELGRFDERFFLYAEETDWQRRASRRSWSSAVCMQAIADHEGAGTSRDARRREALFHAGQETYIRKWHGAVGWWCYRAAAFAGAAGRMLVLTGRRRREATRRALIYLEGPRRCAARGGD
jgi:GT2 family glycosyltransferase